LCKNVQILGLDAHKTRKVQVVQFIDNRRFLTAMAEGVSNVKPNKAMLETIDYKAQM
jgi:hypothetical protein